MTTVSNKSTIATYKDSGEDLLLDFFTKNPAASEDIVRNFWLENRHQWPIDYHLSAQRESLLDWYDFSPHSTCLEIGAGCGACTGILLKKCGKVVANELTHKRAQIIRYRYKTARYLSILEGSLETLETSSQFDYVTVIGVLEYAGRFYDSHSFDYKEAFMRFLKNVRAFMKPKATLFLAIENRIGLKYMSGKSEDHTLRIYDGIDNYPNYQGVRTFSKFELDEILSGSGFSKREYYYPIPDYKMPSFIISERGLRENINITSSALSEIELHGEEKGQTSFSAFSLAHTLRSEGIYDRFSNSFLVLANK